MSPPTSWPTWALPVCPLHEVAVPLVHVPDHTWKSLSEETWAANLALYEPHPERFLALQCEGECWCRPPDARAHSWAGHGRSPSPCPFETRSFDADQIRALVTMRQAQAAGWPLPAADPIRLLDTIAALAHPTGWCGCLPAMLDRLDELPGFLARGWSLETFPSGDPALATLRTASQSFAMGGSHWLWISGGVGRGKTGLAVTLARAFLGAVPARSAFLGRLSPVREELAGETGALLARWLEAVDLLILDDLDFGWAGAEPGNVSSTALADALQRRLVAGRPVVLTAHVGRTALPEQVDPALRALLRRTPLVDVALADGPSLRTGRSW